jgi:hypothetical protein
LPEFVIVEIYDSKIYRKINYHGGELEYMYKNGITDTKGMACKR